MSSSASFRSGRSRSILAIAGWVLIIMVGLALIWFGFLRPSGDGQSEETKASAVALAEALTQPTATRLPATVTAPPPTAPAATPSPSTAPTLPSATALPEDPTATVAPEPTAAASVTVGSSGVNVRGGPGTNYGIVGFLDPGAQAPVTGRYGGWWQILHNDAPGWVYGEIVTASDTDDVPEVQPPAAPTLPPATAGPAPTAVPPTAPPPPPADARGLVADSYQVEGAPGPYSVGEYIYFNLWVTNQSSATVEYRALGTLVQENGQYQTSFVYSEIQPGQQFNHRDHLYEQHITAPGTYHLYLRICFHDGQCADLAGPVEVIVQ